MNIKTAHCTQTMIYNAHFRSADLMSCHPAAPHPPPSTIHQLKWVGRAPFQPNLLSLIRSLMKASWPTWCKWRSCMGSILWCGVRAEHKELARPSLPITAINHPRPLSPLLSSTTPSSPRSQKQRLQISIWQIYSKS